jgi:hypothetical protein
MEILGKILGSSARVKIMRLFLLNKSKGFQAKEVARRSRVVPDVARKEVKLLASIGFIKKRSSASLDWYFNPFFKYTTEFEDLLIRSDSFTRETILANFKNAGKIKLMATSGVFIKNKDSRVDLLLVGDKLKKGKIEEAMRRLEAEVGVELAYAVFETKEFVYRVNMYDKLVRDILDFPHEVVFQAKELSTQVLKKA